MKLLELIYDIREQFGLMSDDSSISNAYIAYLIKNARATILQQRYSDPRNIIPSVEYQSLTIPIGDNAKSSIAIPSIIKTTGNPHASLKIYAAGIADTMLKIPVNVISIERLPFAGSNHFTVDQIYCAIDEDGYLIFNSKNNMYKLLNSVVARGLFEDPEAVYVTAGKGSDSFSMKYPLAESNLLDMRKIIDQKLANILNINKDNLNDSTEERLDQNPQGNK